MNPTVINDRPDAIPEFLAGGGEMGQRIREFDWSKTSLGPVQSWPQSLRTCIRIMLTSRQPIWIGWGKDLIKFYNDPYRAIVGGKHPWALGQPASMVWKDIWKDIGPMLRQVMENDEGTYVESQLLIMDRNGYNEETYYTFSYTPIPGDHGGTAGMICANTDDTDRIISERQLKTLTQLGKRLTDSKSNEKVVEESITTIRENPHDFPFTLFYMIAEGRVLLSSHTDLGMSIMAVPREIDLERDDELSRLLRVAMTTRKWQVFGDIGSKIGVMPKGVWDSPPDKAIVLPIVQSGGKSAYGFLVVGLNPHRLLDDKYSGFFSLVADQVATSFSNVRALEEERKRSEALAAIDLAKTTFFSNISHEFRTPLTLLLGPIEEALSDPDTSPVNRSNLEVAYRNALRMQKLVNALLEFSRIEAGRVEGTFTPVDIGGLTADLASTFRSAIEKAGMELQIHTYPVRDEVYVDIDMWEKIVLNLVSNAFKYCKEGTIRVETKQEGAAIRLSVSDTGIGIPTDQLDKIFDRFHRIENTEGRSQEGTGIGLAMVKELVKLHQGSIQVESEPGKGSSFIVTLPTGKSHLPADKIADTRRETRATVRKAAFAQEANTWLSPNENNHAGGDGNKYKVLLADDNTDMRDYVQRLLSVQYTVLTAVNGEDAWEKMLDYQPDLLLSDIMMPKLDGFGLLKKIRSHPEMTQIPVVFLSARAGEEARVEGLDAGADDYLVKPFSAKELIAVVDANLKINAVRRNARQALEEEVRRRTLELNLSNIALQQSNADLQQFAHVASHDLKEPLRKIKIFAGRLQEDPDTGFSEKGQGYLQKIHGAIDRMMVMVEGVLAYSTVNAEEQTIEKVDLNEVLQNIGRDLELLIAGKNAQFRYGEMPVIEGASVLIYQLLYNIVSNSLKFSLADRQPEIDIRWTPVQMEDADAIRIEVSDNGIGFAQDAAESIFASFARLHSKDKYEGTGLGLALAKKIVERHGGHISARAVPGEGAVFTIVLPLHQTKTTI